MNNICNKIRQKIKVTCLKAFIYADDFMIWEDYVKELEKILAEIMSCRYTWRRQ
jgi:hypothetical protein